ncbi:uncharacterized protein LOC132719677 isoform X2 [Ruditapes philippinarum]|uniref:uncharacterized protein LOC132719677 isoform X2 n=1 Tax=Ruditapes philippinarum TaxID=129788 RepID=UPI00295BA7CF|nr:uncharacterized protein LOC132719677 isoform X2 [Ruditapes philippinarum]
MGTVRPHQPVTPANNLYLARRWDHEIYNTHRKKVAAATTTIVNDPPRLHMHLHIKLKKLQFEAERLATIERDNRILMEKIAHIMRSGGAVDHKKDDYYLKSLNKLKRQRELVRITHENLAILKRLATKDPHYNYKKWNLQWQVNQQYLMNISKFSHPWRQEQSPYQLKAERQDMANKYISKKVQCFKNTVSRSVGGTPQPVIKPKRNAVSAFERRATTDANAKDKATTAKTKKVEGSKNTGSRSVSGTPQPVIKPKRSVVSAAERKTTTGSNAKDKATTAKTKKVQCSKNTVSRSVGGSPQPVIKPKHNAVSAVERKSSTGANEKDKATTAKTPDVTTPAKKEVQGSKNTGSRSVGGTPQPVKKSKHNVVSAVERKASTGAKAKAKATSAKTPDVTATAKTKENPTVDITVTPAAETEVNPTVDPAAETEVNPTVDITVTPAAKTEVTPIVDVTKTPAAETEVTPSVDVTKTPAAKTEVTPSVDVTKTPAAKTEVTPSVDVTKTPAAKTEVTPIVDVTKTPAAKTEVTPSVDVTKTPAAETEVTPIVDVTKTPAAKTEVTPSVDVTKTPAAETEVTPSVDVTKTPGAKTEVNPTVDITVTPAAKTKVNLTIDPAAETEVNPTVDVTVTPAAETEVTPIVDVTKTPAAETEVSPTVDSAAETEVNPTVDLAAETEVNPTVDPLIESIDDLFVDIAITFQAGVEVTSAPDEPKSNVDS